LVREVLVLAVSGPAVLVLAVSGPVVLWLGPHSRWE
jgi:hypothetical protein